MHHPARDAILPGVHHPARVTPGQGRVIPEHADHISHIALGLNQAFARVECLETGDVVGVPLQTISDLGQEAGSFGGGRGGPRPVVEGTTRGPHGVPRIISGGLGNRRHQGSIRRAAHLPSLLITGVSPLAVDEEFGHRCLLLE